MNSSLDALETPRIIIDLDRMEANMRAQQEVCTRHGVELWPHIKTHKMTEIARRQLALGATGLTCAKIGEAEAMLPSGVRRIFIAHSIVDPRSAERIKKLAGQLDELILAATSVAQVHALEKVLATVDLHLPVMMAVDTGLQREGVKSIEQGKAVAQAIRDSMHLKLRGFYTHEGHSYGASPEELDAVIASIHSTISAVRDAVDPSLPIWPGCSVTALRMAALPNVQAVRPGAYVLGDLALCANLPIIPWDRAAITVLATVVDKPEPELALIDAGSKTFSGDKHRSGDSGWELHDRALRVIRCNEEHGYVRDATSLKIGDRLRFVPAHVCAVINLAKEVIVVQKDKIVDTWTVEGRGCNR